MRDYLNPGIKIQAIMEYKGQILKDVLLGVILSIAIAFILFIS